METRREFLTSHWVDMGRTILEPHKYEVPVGPVRTDWHGKDVQKRYNVELPSVTALLMRTVDRTHPITREFLRDVVIPLTVPVDGFDLYPQKWSKPLMNPDVRILKFIRRDLVRLLNDAWTKGYRLYLHDGGRTEEMQSTAYAKSGKDERWVAKPLESQHNTYQAVDFCDWSARGGLTVGSQAGFEATYVYQDFLRPHAWEYGFVEVYIDGKHHDGREDEYWHWLGVGTAVAKAYNQMKKMEWDGDIFDFQAMYGVS